MGVDVNMSSSHCDVEAFQQFKVARELHEISVADVPWKYQQKSHEYTPLDIFNNFCKYKGQGDYAGLSQARLLLEGHGGLRHGVEHLAYSMVYYTPDGGQMAVDAEEEKRRREED